MVTSAPGYRICSLGVARLYSVQISLSQSEHHLERHITPPFELTRISIIPSFIGMLLPDMLPLTTLEV